MTRYALAIYTGCWSSPPISYECVFLWIGVKLCLVKVMDKTQTPYSSQYLTLRQTRCLKLVTHLKWFFLKFKRYSCVKPKKPAPNKSWNHLVCNSQEYLIQQRTVPSIFNCVVTCIHFGHTATGNVLYQSFFSKHLAFQTLNENIRVLFAVLKWALVNKKCDIFDNISLYIGVAMACIMCTQSC